jgi:Carboxylesterase family
MKLQRKDIRIFSIALFGMIATLLAAGVAQAQVPANIESELIKMGHIVDPPCVAKLYRPLMPANDITSSVTPLYPGVTIARNISFGPDPDDVVDIFAADKGPKSRPVLIYVPGGVGNKIEIQDKEANAFYDNIGRWATKNGMVGVNMERHARPGWDGGAKDISAMIQWVQANISKYYGNPDRMFLWTHSAGNIPVGNYIGHPELYGPKGVGLKGVIFMSPAPFNIAPLAPPPMNGPNILATAGKTCNGPDAFSAQGAIPGVAPGHPGGPPAPAGSQGPGGPGGPPDAATMLTRSNLPELKKTPVKIMLANGDLDIYADPAVDGGIQPFNRLLHDELCKEGPDRCPTLLLAKGHSHVSLVFSIDSPDTTVSGPILAWIKSVK